jgi:uncharacterized protein YqhQ
MAIQRASGGADESPNPTNVGGQAVIEGVMMRAPGSLSIVCRRRNGSLVVRERTIEPSPSAVVKLPFVRGALTLFSALKVGHQALRWSAELLEQDLDAEEKAQQEREGERGEDAPPSQGGGAPKAKQGPGGSTLAVLALSLAKPLLSTGDEAPGGGKKGGGLAMLIPIALALALFIALPQAVAELVSRWFDLDLAVTSPAFQAITGAAKLTIIVGYMALIRLIPDVRRVFQYHGAEHKAISTYEKGLDLVVENARGTTALHARCGTTFIIMVAFVSVVLFSIVGAFLPPMPGSRIVQNVLLFGVKLPLIPVLAGITYELQRLFARYCSTGPLRVVLWPGFLVQKITTAEPDDEQLEVALASLRSALANAKVKLPADHPDRTFASYGTLVSDPSYAA